jgi:vancomycin permeability regulator SanA
MHSLGAIRGGREVELFSVLRFSKPLKRQWKRNLGMLVAAAVVVALLFLALPIGYTYFSYQGRIYTNTSAIQSKPVAIVFGAFVQPDGRPSLMLSDRVDAAVELYRQGKVSRILMTGDNSRPEYNEVEAMKSYAVAAGVPADRINLDYAGFRTYDSCYRAKQVFGVTKAILVTQNYHLPRALYIANSLGIDAVGYKAGRDDYPLQTRYNLRESLALAQTWYEINIFHPLPMYLGAPIDLETQNQ